VPTSVDMHRAIGGAASGTKRFAESAHPATLTSRMAVVAVFFLATLPVAMALANRSAPLFQALAAVAVLTGVLAQGGWNGLAATWRDLWHSPVAMTTLFGLALCLASILWSVDQAQTMRSLGEAVFPLFAGVVLLLFLPRIAPPWTATAVALGVSVAAAICVGDIALDMPIRAALHLRAKEFEYNRPILTLLVLFWPICALAMSRHGPSMLSWMALIGATIAVWVSYSGTSMFAQTVSIIAALFAWRHPRASLAATAIVLAMTFLSVFAFGDIAGRVLPGGFVKALAWTHAADRLEIWQSYGAAMLLHPLLGSGFGTSVTLGDTVVASQVASEFRRMLAVGHPHNGFLQIGVELGMLGCLVALAILLLLLRSWVDLKGAALWSRIGLLTLVAAIMLVGHGAWQAWWIAAVFTGAGLTRTFVPAGGEKADPEVHPAVPS
jgi:O-antigen ligase